MLTTGTKIKLLGKLYEVIEVTEFGAKIKPIKKISRGKYQSDGKSKIISANTIAKVIK